MKTPCTGELLAQGTSVIICFLNLCKLWEVCHLILLCSAAVKCSTSAWTIYLNSVGFSHLDVEIVVLSYCWKTNLIIFNFHAR